MNATLTAAFVTVASFAEQTGLAYDVARHTLMATDAPVVQIGGVAYVTATAAAKARELVAALAA